MNNIEILREKLKKLRERRERNVNRYIAPLDLKIRELKETIEFKEDLESLKDSGLGEPFELNN